MKPTAETLQPLKCPKCRHTWTPRPPRVRRFRVSSSRPKPAPVVATVDTAALSTADLFKHYQKTGPLEDVRFWLKHARMSAGLRFAFEVLEASIVELKIRDRKTILRELCSLQQMWRAEANRRQWAAGYVATFTPAWPIDRLLPAPALETADEVAA